MLQCPVQTAMQPIFFRYCEIRFQQLIHRAIREPLPMHAKLAARVQQPIRHQLPQHLLPTHPFAGLGQALLPELIQPQLMPQLAGQPAVAEHSRPPQFQPAQLYRHTVQRISRQFPVVREQAHGGVTFFVLDKYIQRSSPGGLLLVVDLAQVQNRPLHGLTASQPMILDDAEVAVVLAILSSVGAAQEHGKQQNARVLSERKEGRSSLSGFPRTRVGAKGLGTYALAKGGRNCEGEVSREPSPAARRALGNRGPAREGWSRSDYSRPGLG